VINFVYENIKDLVNYTACEDINPSNIRRFAPAPIANAILHRTQNQSKAHSIFNRPEHYIIPTGVNHHPNDWTGSSLAFNNTRNTAFSYLSDTYLNDVRAGRAMLMFDQSLEGYQTSWLWEYFHTECDQYQVTPKQVIYVTGNANAKDQYETWANQNNKVDRLNIIVYKHFEMDVKQAAKINGIDFQEQLDFKIANLEKIKTYNCLQKRLRPHRTWIYKYLYDSGLLDHGMVSMNPFLGLSTEFEGQTIPHEQLEALHKPLPLILYDHNNNERDDRFYIDRILPQVHLDTWVTVISEASVGDSELTLFLSEKAFKPIACSHPFIFMGNRGSLAKLREMGYKTFDGFIDETYDTLSTWERMQAVIDSIKEIHSIKDKVKWYNDMRPILEHNKNLLMSRESSINPAYTKLNEIFSNFSLKI
jgi:hypothetical protein